MTRTSSATDTDGLDTATTVGIQLQRIRAFWPLVALITLGAVIAAAVSAYVATPTYTGRTVLIVSSPGRVPSICSTTLLTKHVCRIRRASRRVRRSRPAPPQQVR
jgi:uncharacterized protein involved in exopolysaccharide biosynthesis